MYPQRHLPHGGHPDRPPSAPPLGGPPFHAPSAIPKPNHFPQPSHNGTEPRPTLPPCTPPTLAQDWRFSKRDIDARYSMHTADRNQVRSLRAKGVHFMFSLATRMLVSQATLATAATLFHRFFMSQSFDAVHQYDIATVAMYHAAKAEERVLKLDHVAEMAYLSANKDPHLHAINEDERKKWVARIRELEPWFAASIGFDFYIEHPYRPLNNFLCTTKVPVAVGRLAMVFINDSLRTTLCLQHPPTVVAAAALRLASKLLDPLPVPLRPDWMQAMGVDRLAVLDAAGQLLEVHEARWAAITAPPPQSRSTGAGAGAGRGGGMSSSSTTPGSTYSGGVRTPNNVASSNGGSAGGTPVGYAGGSAGAGVGRAGQPAAGASWGRSASAPHAQGQGQASWAPQAAGHAGSAASQPGLGASHQSGASGGGSEADMDLEEGEL